MAVLNCGWSGVEWSGERPGQSPVQKRYHLRPEGLQHDAQSDSMVLVVLVVVEMLVSCTVKTPPCPRRPWLHHAPNKRKAFCGAFAFFYTSFASVHFAVPMHMPKVQATDYGMRLAMGGCSE